MERRWNKASRCDRGDIPLADLSPQISRFETVKTTQGNFFEDFQIDQVIEHSTPRTIREGDVTLYQGLTGSRFPLQSAEPFAKRAGLLMSPIDDLMTFNVVFGKTVPDISLNAIANLGYAEGMFHGFVYPGDTLSSRSTVIGLKENSNGKTGVVYVRTVGSKNSKERVLDYVRWVMVRKREAGLSGSKPVVPELKAAISAEDLRCPEGLDLDGWNLNESGSRFALEDYEVGEKIDHVDGMSVMETEHRLATRLYQNTARVHFNNHTESQSRLASTIVYGGVVISIARALSFSGLGNAAKILAINSGSHINPCVGGDTIYAWSEVLDQTELTDQAGALRLRLVAAKNRSCADFPLRDNKGNYLEQILLDFDYWVLIPKRKVLQY